MKKLLLVLAIFGACTFSLTSCGNKSAEEQRHEDAADVHEDAADAADDADNTAAEQMHEAAADAHEDSADVAGDKH